MIPTNNIIYDSHLKTDDHCEREWTSKSSPPLVVHNFAHVNAGWRKKGSFNQQQQQQQQIQLKRRTSNCKEDILFKSEHNELTHFFLLGVFHRNELVRI